MSRKTNTRYQPSDQHVVLPSLEGQEAPPYTPPATDEAQKHWVVLEDRQKLAINGIITQVKQGKVVHDADLARKYMALGVKMEERG